MGMENKMIPGYAITASSEVGLTILVMFLLSLNIQAICMLG